MVRTGSIGKQSGSGWKLISGRKSWIEVFLMTLTVRARESVGVERTLRLLSEWFIETIAPSRSLVILLSLVIARNISRLADIKLRVTHTPGF